ncbi:prepilin-type N-terminal cleavage/methylation domain-containing protein [bacterium CPR1]|nr:prepilin-type N-terminal cleavage/methylation domain-containing protein [bacterium CPR1]
MQVRSRRGFTLIELMIVLMIMLILMTLLAPTMIKARYRAQLTACMDTVKHLATALEQYSVDNKVYPLALNPAFTTAYLNRPKVVCPSSQQDYTYQVDNVEHSFTIYCGTGKHDVALPGVVLNGFPQFSHHLGSVTVK